MDLRTILIVFMIQNASSFPENKLWNIFKFVQEWPSAVCAINHRKCNKVPGIVKGFTIHGLWPNNKDGAPVTFCNKSWPFDWNKVKILKPQLEAHWPNLFKHNKKSEDEFWAEEWRKHGTCATSVPATGNEYLYFKTTIGLNSRFNINKALQQANVTPSCNKTYNVCEIQKTIKTFFKMPGFPRLEHKELNGRNMLGGITICMTKDFKFDQCYNKKTACHTHTDVYFYPEHTKCPWMR